MSALDDRIRDLVEQRKALTVRLDVVMDELNEAYRLRYDVLLSHHNKTVAAS